MRLSTISAVALVPLVAAAAIDNRAAIRRHHELQQRGAMDEFVSAILNPVSRAEQFYEEQTS
jgi:hypothetical protein